MGFHEIQLPTDMSYGSAGGPGYNTNIVELDSGAEETVQRWSTPRHSFDISKGIQTYAQLTTLKAFYIARGGPANGFRFKDFLDYHSSPTDSSFHSAMGTKDQRIGTGDGTTTVFQLIKLYTSGAITITRSITKPVSGTVSIWIAGTLKTSGVDYTVDTTTGLVTMTTAPTVGQAVEASFEFDVPVRFGKELDAVLSIDISDFGAGTLNGIRLVEMISPDTGNVGEFPYGGGTEQSISANVTITPALARVWILSATTTGLSAVMANPASIPTGAPLCYVENGGSNTITLKDNSGNTLASLTAGTCVEVFLVLDNLGAKVYYAA